MEKPSSISTIPLFPVLRKGLIELLNGLSTDDWARPTVCSGWTVKDVTAHLLAGDVGVLSRHRDQYNSPDVTPPQNYAQLVALINSLNDTWVRALRRISPPLLCTLLDATGPQIDEYFASLDPNAPGPPVDWAGEGPQPNWMDLAREYTERWHHQQQIRDAVSKPGMKEARFLRPVLDAFARSLPRALQDATAKDGAEVQFSIRGDAGRDWLLLREAGRWALYIGVAAAPAAEIHLDQDDAWRLFTKGLRGDAARQRVSIRGDAKLAERALGAVAILG